MPHPALLACLLGIVLACQGEGRDSGDGNASASVPVVSEGPADRYLLHPVDTLGDTTTWGFARRMELVGEYLVVADFYATYQMIVVDTATGEVRGAFGRKGGGPREVQVPRLMYVESDSPPQLWIYDSGNRRATLWSIDHAGLGAPIEPTRSVRVELEGVDHSPYFTSDGMIFTTRYGDALLYLSDSAGRVERTVGELPYETTEYLYDVVVNSPIPVVDPARRRVALPFLRTNRVDFYEVSGRHIATSGAPVDVPDLHIARIDGQRRYEPPLPMTFGRGSATARYVYLPYCPGCNTADRPQEYREVQVFDWTGAFVATLDLGGPSWAIEASNDDALLYAVIVDPYPLVLTFRLPEELRAGNGR